MKIVIKILVLVILIFNVNKAQSQDSLTIEQLQPISFAFNIEDGRLTGEGAHFLRKEMSQAQFTMIGEYHGSKRISEFTEVVIPILDSLAYKTMVVEVGPVSGQALNELNVNTQTELRTIIEKYKITEEDGYVNEPIPFFANVEDANFLKQTKLRKWNIIGIDQEYYFSNQMLLDRMYNNLSTAEQSNHEKLYQQVSDSIANYYKLDLDGTTDLSESIKKSKVLKAFTSKMSIEPANAAIVDALYTSNHIYWLNVNRQWFENNATRIKYMKTQLKKQLEENEFNLNKDKLLIKMGAYHLSKGFSPLGLHEVGSTLNEIAEYNGNTTLNIAFSPRFYMEEGKLIDIMESTSAFDKRLKDLNQMGRKEEWMVIDLRPMIKGHFYHPVKYKFNEHVKDLVKRYDLLVIPKIESDPTPNY